tara:strand:+ start:52554 stop:53756 length:1203 start_codon:yes stop_codon:yes gene_type:complete
MGISHLTLSENLTTFPIEILSLADSLEILDLSNNQLKSIPAEIKQLNKLKIIFASNNLFEDLPESLGQCKSLEMIGFKANKIKDVPEQSLPVKLRWLILTDNQITRLPDSLGERPRMQKLALSGNQLKELPANLAQLYNLELVRISANDITQFPDQLLNLPKLAWLAFSGNPFSRTKSDIQSIPSVASSSLTLHNVLGQGASGVISKAVWNSPTAAFPEEVAIKVFKSELTSDGYPEDELQACLKVGEHANLIKPLAQINEKHCLALVMELIPEHYNNLGLPPDFDTCTRDTFKVGFTLSIGQISKIVEQMQLVFTHLHQNLVCHGDLYAHNTLFDQDANIIFGDFGAASMYHMLNEKQQAQIQKIERRALHNFIQDLLSVCNEEDKISKQYKFLNSQLH